MTDVSNVRDTPTSVQDIIARAEAAADDERVSIRDVVEEIGVASFAPGVTLLGLIVVTPASGIPFLSSVCGISIALISLQMVMNRDHLWLPDWILRREISQQRLFRVLNALQKPARWLDRRATARLDVLFHRPLVLLPQLVCVMAGATMPFFEILPFLSSVLGLTVSILGIAMVTRDGLLVLLGLATFALTILTVTLLVP